MKDGITLITLVITIIVLILLSVVTVSSITGSNGLINKLLEAKIANDKGEIQDKADTEALASIERNGEINWKELKKNLAKKFRIDENSIKDEGEGLTFTIEKNKKNYRVDIDGKGNVTVTYDVEDTEST